MKKHKKNIKRKLQNNTGKMKVNLLYPYISPSIK